MRPLDLYKRRLQLANTVDRRETNAQLEALLAVWQAERPETYYDRDAYAQWESDSRTIVRTANV